MITTTISSSISVKPVRRRVRVGLVRMREPLEGGVALRQTQGGWVFMSLMGTKPLRLCPL
jgi:hypothetical protein